MSKKKKTQRVNETKNERTFDYGTHPGAYTTEYDDNNVLLDTVNSADDIFKYNIRHPQRNA